MKRELDFSATRGISKGLRQDHVYLRQLVAACSDISLLAHLPLHHMTVTAPSSLSNPAPGGGRDAKSH